MRRSTLLALLFFPIICSAQDFCAYKSTNDLVWDKGFEQRIKQFFGNKKDDFYWKGGLLSDQAIAGLGGPPDDIRRLSPELIMASACRAHSCMEKAAVIVACPSSIVAVGILHFDCSHACSSDATITLFFNNKNKARQGQSELETWGREAAKSEGHKFEYKYRTQSNRLLQPTTLPLPRQGGD